MHLPFVYTVLNSVAYFYSSNKLRDMYTYMQITYFFLGRLEREMVKTD